MIDKKKKIRNFLKKKKRASTTRIASHIKAGHWLTKRYLEDMKMVGEVICEEETQGQYWRLVEK